MDLRPIGLLERSELRKVAADCGFDVLTDGERLIEAVSTQAPLRVWLGWMGNQPVIGLDMAAVAAELRPGEVVILQTPAAAAAEWRAFPDVRSMDVALLQAWRLSRALPNALETRFAAQLAASTLTEREASIRQRIGQDLFRDGLMTLWGGRCALTRLDEPLLLRASHAKPWAQASDAERLDVYNGLLLAAHLDAAFDAGLIALRPDGTVEPSPALSDRANATLGLGALAPARLNSRHQPYLAWHRQHIFRC